MLEGLKRGQKVEIDFLSLKNAFFDPVCGHYRINDSTESITSSRRFALSKGLIFPPLFLLCGIEKTINETKTNKQTTQQHKRWWQWGWHSQTCKRESIAPKEICFTWKRTCLRDIEASFGPSKCAVDGFECLLSRSTSFRVHEASFTALFRFSAPVRVPSIAVAFRA